MTTTAAALPSSPTRHSRHPSSNLCLDEIPSTAVPCHRSFLHECWHSVDTILLQSGKLTWLLLLGPCAVVGDASGLLAEAPRFVLAGLALIPCAERLSFVTEQVAAHTNGTIGALLNATFGNAPELLISVAALRSGFYRVVQLAMLGSILTNLILVFGVACVIGGCRWQVQTLRIPSGNVNVGMLLLACAGFLLPAILIVSGQLLQADATHEYDDNARVPSTVEVSFSRVNAVVLMVLYLCYLLFQLGTHKDEYDEDVATVVGDGGGTVRRAEENVVCRSIIRKLAGMFGLRTSEPTAPQLGWNVNYEMVPSPNTKRKHGKGNGDHPLEPDGGAALGMPGIQSDIELAAMGNQSVGTSQQDVYLRSRSGVGSSGAVDSSSGLPPLLARVDSTRIDNTAMPYHDDILGDADAADDLSDSLSRATDPRRETSEHLVDDDDGGPLISMRVGVAWLFIITLCVSALSDILVDTIDGFAERLHLSEVFTSMVIIPFFSNVAEQVSAFIFAYRDEMDLVVGVTVGSAVQIATFVLPGAVLIGYLMDRSMTLYFHPYETTCLVFGVICVAAVLQGGTTNWLVGVTLVGVYVIIAAGIWFHELENLAVDEEVAIQNSTKYHAP